MGSTLELDEMQDLVVVLDKSTLIPTPQLFKLSRATFFLRHRGQFLKHTTDALLSALQRLFLPINPLLFRLWWLFIILYGHIERCDYNWLWCKLHQRIGCWWQIIIIHCANRCRWSIIERQTMLAVQRSSSFATIKERLPCSLLIKYIVVSRWVKWVYLSKSSCWLYDGVVGHARDNLLIPCKTCSHHEVCGGKAGKFHWGLLDCKGLGGKHYRSDPWLQILSHKLCWRRDGGSYREPWSFDR